ncbi:ORC-CDC6 family AAA ATPase [Bradyrhizobium sp. HKCCYLS3013]|uniref:ORC-CDC6 family AAA ATPase n=1 Tax=Bradyrhizobium sp. HKCCYLS3013 TaxID=3420735 RepID=UPI003EBA08D7
MIDFFFRTEDIRPEAVVDYFVETAQDRATVDALKNRNPTILIGSRGVGKSFLLRVAQRELAVSFEQDRVFPVYLSFVRSSLLQSADPDQFKHWMLARICSAIIRSLMKEGLLSSVSQSARLLAGSDTVSDAQPTRLEVIAGSFEDSWQNPNSAIENLEIVPSVDALKEALEDISSELSISRFVLLIDEAAHIFLPEQQRLFFTLFRDLRSHCITCNAAVYPGVTSYGETFQPAHDATMISIDRDVLAPTYVDNMREIVEKQADSTVLKNIARNGKNFAVLAYAAAGNPRLLLKTLASSPAVDSTQINLTIREYYRSDIWSEHSLLADKYSGHRTVIDWGRQFIESIVLPEIKTKNDQYLAADKATSAYVWIHRDAPALVKEALRILSYTGVVIEQASGIKASRAEVGTRYMINLGCLFSLEARPASTSFDIAKGLTPKRMTEFGANHSAFKSLADQTINAPDESKGAALKEQLTKSIDVLDISKWQYGKLVELGLLTVGDVLKASEKKLMEASYVGNVRARQMRNAAVAAVLEYLSG